MGLREWIAGVVGAVDREYDRRIRRASNVTAYGLGHVSHADHEEEEEAVIVNVPRGTVVPSREKGSRGDAEARREE